jgi:hypothetical protein
MEFTKVGKWRFSNGTGGFRQNRVQFPVALADVSIGCNTHALAPPLEAVSRVSDDGSIKRRLL